MAHIVYRGVERVRSPFILTLSAENLARLHPLPAECGVVAARTRAC